MADSDRAPEWAQDSIEHTPSDQPERAKRSWDAGTEYHNEYLRTGNTADLDKAIQEFQQSIDLTPSKDSQRAERLQSSGIAYRDRYQRTGDMKDLDISIQNFQRSIDETTSGFPAHAKGFHGLGTTYHDRFHRTGNIAYLDMAMQQLQQSVDETPSDDLQRPGRLTSLGASHLDKYRQTSDMADLDIGIQYYQESVDQTPSGHAEHARRVQILGTGYHDRYRRTSSMTDLDLAIQHYQNAVDETPPDNPQRAERHMYLGTGYHDKYQRTGSIADLDMTAQQFQQSLARTPQDHPQHAARRLYLGIAYGSRWQRTGNTKDLDLAIEEFQQVIDQTPLDHIERAGRLQNLGTGYRDRYIRTGNTTDLDMAIKQFQQCAELTPSNHLDRPWRLLFLGTGYGDRYQRSGSKKDLELAIQYYQQSVDQTLPDHPECARGLLSLGTGLHDQYQQTKDLADLDKAIQQFQLCVEKTPSGHPEIARRLQSVGAGFHDKFQQTKNMDDLNMAIQQFQECVEKTPSDHLERSERLWSLGTAYHDLYQQTQDQSNLDMAIEQLQESVDHTPSLIQDRLKSAIALLPMYAITTLWNKAFTVAHTVMQLVPFFTPRFLKTADKQHLLAMIAGLASDSAASAMNAAKDSADAVQLLELGRGVISGSLSEMRTDITTLLSSHPDLGQKYIDLRNLLDSPEDLEEQDETLTSNNSSSLRYNAGNKMEELLSSIRNQPGFEEFLLAPKKESIQSAAMDGPLIIINVSQYRCDAILIESDAIQSLALPALSSKDIKEKTRKRDFGSPETLEWMWHTIANPVLDALNLNHSPPDGIFPHVWWIPTGSLAKFPIHAAGFHKKNSSETVIDRVMSSYGSSVKAILHGRSSRYLDVTPSPSASPQALLVAVPDAPGSLPLPFATKEVATLHELCKSMALDPIEPGRRKADVISHLPQCKIFHFAGHGFTDSIDPSRSYLLLEDGRNDPLTVATLLEMNIREHLPFLAYLSACGTGQINDERFLDESIHLISAFQLAGFRHVVGTLWEVNDEMCVDVARIVYEGMRDGHLSDESVCLGLHNASRKLRDDWLSVAGAKRGLKKQLELRDAGHGDERDDVLSRDALICEDDDEGSLNWVPYVHYGV